MRALLVGEAPAPCRIKPTYRAPLPVVLAMRIHYGNRAWARGAEEWEESSRHPDLSWIANAAFENLLAEWPGGGQRGSEFPLPLARDGARRLRERLMGGEFGRLDLVMLAGKRVARAWGIREPEYLRQVAFGFAQGGRCLALSTWILPHPSGLNRWWNSEENLALIRAWAKEMAECGRSRTSS